MSCVSDLKKESNTIMAREYTRDYRDTTAWKKIPKEYQIIGICGYKRNYQGQTLHIADFQIWKPRKNWLSFQSLVEKIPTRDAQDIVAKNKLHLNLGLLGRAAS